MFNEENYRHGPAPVSLQNGTLSALFADIFNKMRMSQGLRNEWFLIYIKKDFLYKKRQESSLVYFMLYLSHDRFT